ncbi:MAG: TldD/PmbA family protein [Candidatus Saliniplasma sp.]
MVSEELKRSARKVLDKVEVDEVEVLIHRKDKALTRYANSKIHQNVGQKDFDVSIRAVLGKKIGSVSTNSVDEKSLIDALRSAENIAKHQKEDPDFIGLPEPKEDRSDKENYFEETASFTPDDRAEKVKEIIHYAGEKGVDRMYGAFETETIEVLVANTNGIMKSSRMSKANLTATAIADWDNDQGFGWSEQCSANVNDIDHMKVARTAVEKGLNNMDTKSIEPGEYNVVLEPLAVNTMLMYLAMMGMSAKKVQEKRSFMNGKFGEKIMDERVNIFDDAMHDEMIGFPFDYEGVPKQRVDMVKDGIAKDVVYDSYTAGRDEEDRESTGHALPMPNPMSPAPLNLMMGTGDASVQEMIDDTENGILVTRFNYCRPVHPVKGILTGLTRDGTWKIENGEVTEPLKNLRFTQNLLDAFSDVELIGKERILFSLGYYPGYTCVPAMKIPEFNFTGTTEF